MIVSLRNGRNFQQKFLLDVVTQVVDLVNGLSAVYVDVHVFKEVDVVYSDDVAHLLLLLIVWCC